MLDFRLTPVQISFFWHERDSPLNDQTVCVCNAQVSIFPGTLKKL